ncbi:MAG TPA: YdaS family helix-turn-helix protein [Rhodocyclaceae bacterium]|nr:YdaS family helix-turn-helix protein [Rhodocyclaceae bacterium]
MEDILKTAIQLANGPAAVSALFNIRPQAVSQWVICPPDRVIALCGAGGWRVTPHQLRSDLYPNATDALPPELTQEMQGQAAHV